MTFVHRQSTLPMAIARKTKSVRISSHYRTTLQSDIYIYTILLTYYSAWWFSRSTMRGRTTPASTYQPLLGEDNKKQCLISKGKQPWLTNRQLIAPHFKILRGIVNPKNKWLGWHCRTNYWCNSKYAKMKIFTEMTIRPSAKRKGNKQKESLKF